jgi:hypothetical protein
MEKERIEEVVLDHILSFAVETLKRLRMGHESRPDDLEGDDAVEAEVRCFIDLAHAAFAKPVQNLIAR